MAAPYALITTNEPGCSRKVLYLLHDDAQESHFELRGTCWCANVLSTDAARRMEYDDEKCVRNMPA